MSSPFLNVMDNQDESDHMIKAASPQSGNLGVKKAKEKPYDDQSGRYANI